MSTGGDVYDNVMFSFVSVALAGPQAGCLASLEDGLTYYHTIKEGRGIIEYSIVVSGIS
jgi:hypothetical protein